MDLSKQFPQEFRRVSERAWSDEAFKALLLSDPIEALAQEGIEIPQAVLSCGVTFKVVQDSDSVRHVVLPPRPSDELSDLELASVAGGKGKGAGGTAMGNGEIYSGFR